MVEETKKKWFRPKLQTKFLFGLVMTLVILIVALGIVITSLYRSSMEEYYSNLAFDCAALITDNIDGDTIEGYHATLKKDAYYDEVRAFLLNVKQTYGLKYLYVVVPTDVQFYIWDAGREGEYGVCDLGDTDKFYGGGYKVMHAAFDDPKATGTILITNNDEYGYLASAYVAILDSNNNPVALSCVDISMDQINDKIRSFMLIITAIIAGILLVTMIAYYFFIRSSVIRPVHKVRDAASKIVDDLDNTRDFQVDVHTGDEIEELADAFRFMSVKLRKYIDNLSHITAEKERISAELDVATRIQADMLPSIFPAFPDRNDFDIYATMLPAKEVGGDFYDFFIVDDDHLALVVADVSGKGVPAALFMMISKILLKNAVLTGASPKQVLEMVNNQLYENNKEDMFVTVWLGILKLSTGELTHASAGHENPLWLHEGEWSYVKERHGFVLAGMENMRYKEFQLTLSPGDAIFQYTDGVTEATNVQSELFGEKRLLATIGADVARTPSQLLFAVKADIDAFVAEAPQFDDITMLCFTYRGPQKPSLLHIPAKIEELEAVTAYVDEMLEEAGCSLKAKAMLDIAIDEVFSNICFYSGSEYADIHCKLSNGAVELVFVDWGKAYDPTEKSDPDVMLSAEERKIGGLGIYIVKKNMDEVRYERKDEKNVLTLIKKI